jgi:hypothetical protein
MKRSLKKLTLNRDTILRLNEERLVAVAGGSGTTCTPQLQYALPGRRDRALRRDWAGCRQLMQAVVDRCGPSSVDAGRRR